MTDPLFPPPAAQAGTPEIALVLGSGGARGTSASLAPAGPAGARQNVLTGVQP